jgi:hypothetical protein
VRDRIRYVGLDVHKEGIVVAGAEGGLRGEVREYGRIANTPSPTSWRRARTRQTHSVVPMTFSGPDDIFRLKEPAFARQARCGFASAENHGLENAGSLCHGGTETIGGML